METFEDIWEREGRWISGPGLLGDIVRFLEGRSLVAEPDLRNPNQVNVALPLPTVQDEVSGRKVSIVAMVPEELQPIFFKRYTRIIQRRIDGEAIASLEAMLGVLKNTAHDLARLDNMLASFEHHHVARGDLELWQIAAEEFGLPPFVPVRHFFASLASIPPVP